MNSLISVIVPVYNVEKYLYHCIRSIVDQTYNNLEIILVDDGSTDGCSRMCDEWCEKDARIKVIHKKNGGLSDARNTGLSVASGDYISFIDSDDWVDLHFIEYLYSAITTYKAEIAACDVSVVPDDDKFETLKINGFQTTPYSTEEALKTLIHGCTFRAVAWNKLYKKNILKNELFRVGRLHEDEFFTYRILAKCKSPVFVKAPLYIYRQRVGSITKSFSVKRLDSLDALLERLEFLKSEYPGLYKEDKATFCKLCSNLYCNVLCQSFSEKEVAKKKIKESRKKIHFRAKELCHYKIKDVFYIFGTHPLMIEVVSRLRIKIGYEKK